MLDIVTTSRDWAPKGGGLVVVNGHKKMVTCTREACVHPERENFWTLPFWTFKPDFSKPNFFVRYPNFLFGHRMELVNMRANFLFGTNSPPLIYMCVYVCAWCAKLLNFIFNNLLRGVRRQYVLVWLLGLRTPLKREDGEDDKWNHEIMTANYVV